MTKGGDEPETQNINVTEGKKSEDTQDAIRKLKAKLVPGVRYTLLVSLIVYLAMLIVGILAVKKCPVNEDIPLFLCIMGFVGLASKLTTYLRDRIVPIVKIKYVESALYSTELVFFILGTYWVYKEFQPSYDPADGSKYCQKTAYLFAFCYLTVFYGFILLLLLLGACLCCCMCLGLNILDKIIKHDIESSESQVPYIDEEVGGNKNEQ